MTATLEASDGLTGPEVVTRLESAIDDLATRLDAGIRLSQVIIPHAVRPRSRISSRLESSSWWYTPTISIDQFQDSASVLQRSALARCTRALATILAGRHPGRSVEVRVPPYAAVQCAIGDPGPTHTRGTPPNVVETRSADVPAAGHRAGELGRCGSNGSIHASGLRADLAPLLPLLS